MIVGALVLAGSVSLIYALAETPSQAPAAAPSPITPISITPPPDLTAKDISFQGSDAITLHGTILEPATPMTRRPGVVLVHGSGAGTPRTKLLEEATAFARQGLCVLIYDKRSAGYSLFQRSYSQLADDALGAVRTLRAHAGVDPAKVGIWGVSEGGWVAPLAAARSADVAFVIVVGANAMVPLRQQTWAVASALRRAGVSGSLLDRAEPNMYRLLANAKVFPEAYHDGEAVLGQVRQPLLGIWGDHDLLTPPEENPALFARALRQGGNTQYTLRFFLGADHAVHQSPDGGLTRLPSLAPGYAELVGAWVGDVTAGRRPNADAATPPRQDWPSMAVPPSAWWEAVWIQLAMFALFIVAFAGYALVALLRRVRGRSVLAPGGRPARLLASTGAAAVLGLFVYVPYLLMGNAKDAAPGPVLAGRPLPWLLLQALALTAVGASVATVVAWRQAGSSVSRGERLRLGLLLAGGVVFVPWALYWGQLMP
jgi:dienelactone hydrolase